MWRCAHPSDVKVRIWMHGAMPDVKVRFKAIEGTVRQIAFIRRCVLHDVAVRPSVRHEDVCCIAFTFQTYRHEDVCCMMIRYVTVPSWRAIVWREDACCIVFTFHPYRHEDVRCMMWRCVTVPSWRAPVWREGAMIKAIEGTVRQIAFIRRCVLHDVAVRPSVRCEGAFMDAWCDA